jgi:NADPH:quinone reductase-like Zn-dependent oxidoreductase
MKQFPENPKPIEENMKKITFGKFGPADVLQMAEVEIPALNATAILIKVKAVSINPLDWKIFRGEMKIMSGSKFPMGLGIDFSGVVEKTGAEIIHYKKGDEVFGLLDVFKGGALAEYILVNESQVTLKPSKVSFEQAAALPVAGASALQIINNLAPVKSDTEILINGATGGIGMFAIQLAKRKGANITAVTNEKGIDLAKEWGATQVLDYRKQNVLTLANRFDVFIDLSGKLPFYKAKSLLTSKGTYVSTLPGPREIIGSFLNNLFFRKKYKILFLKPTSDHLHELAKLAGDGMSIVIDKTYPMEAFSKAYDQTSRGGVLGKVVFRIPF